MIESTRVSRDGAGMRTHRPIRLGLSLGLVAALLGLGCATTEPEKNAEGVPLSVAIRNVGIDHLNQGRTAMAIRKLEESLGKDPEDPVTHLWLGEAYRRKGLFERAEQHLLRSLELNPKASDYNHQETVLNLCGLYIQMKRYEHSIARCQALIDDPTFSTPWRALTNRGWAHYQMGQIAEARQSFEEAIDFFPRYSPAHLNLGILDQREKRYLSAIRHFELAIESQRLGPEGDAEANYRMAEVYVALGKRSKAIEHFSVAMEQAPYAKWGTQSKTYLDLLR